MLKHARALQKVDEVEKPHSVSQKEVVFDNIISEIDININKGIG